MPRSAPHGFTPVPLALVVLVALLPLSACDDEPIQPENPQSIEISVTPASLTVAQGGTAEITITLISTGGYASDVVVAAENSPDGVTIGGGTIEGGSGSTQLGVAASAGAVLGTANIRIRAIGPGVSETQTTLSVTVEASP